MEDWQASRDYRKERKRLLSILSSNVAGFEAAARRLAPHLSRSVVTELVRHCREGDARVQEATVCALCCLAPHGDRAVISLCCDLVEAGEGGARESAVLCLGEVARGDLDAVMRLADAAVPVPPKGGSAAAPVGSGTGADNAQEVLATLEEVRARLIEIAEELGARLEGDQEREEKEAATRLSADVARRTAALHAIAVVLRGRAAALGDAREPLLAVLFSLKVRLVRLPALHSAALGAP